MRISSLVSFAGFLLIIIGSYCPLLRPFGLFNMNVFKLSQPYGMTILLVAVIGILGVFLNRIQLVKFSAWVALILVSLLLLASVLKVNTSFSFIPFKSISGFLAKQIRFKWGWYVLFAGPVLALIGAFSTRQLSKIQKPDL
ncbi:hypothetical protein ACFQZS_07965 [Mucilaginibacter calamicampi]|uniref:Topoisomerase VI B subunit, transducer n=1 Tax=Mucilaginibacter calamicampi TaxID=1302352 RepID=A0ABW2YXF5_9SPHI